MSRTLVVGDVHGCARALERVVTSARPDRVVLVGDVFPKGPEPARTWEVLRDCGAVGVMGNHDARLLDAWGKRGDSVHHRTWPLLSEAARDWLAELPLHRTEAGRLVVHAGLHPTEGLAGSTTRVLLTVRRWPDDLDLDNPFWWQLYDRETPVVYGHDAMRGLQLHARTSGLDTGCVYGGVLTGLVLETGELTQADQDGRAVPAPRPDR